MSQPALAAVPDNPNNGVSRFFRLVPGVIFLGLIGYAGKFVEQSIAAGVRMPFLADDLFVNFDDDRAAAGLRVLAELAASTQVLFFTHHAHLRDIGRRAVGADLMSECVLS